MVLGGVQHERISVNHDLLWRQFCSYQEHKTASDINKGSDLLFKSSENAHDSKIIKFKGLDRKEQNAKKSRAEHLDKGMYVKGMSGNFASEIIWMN